MNAALFAALVRSAPEEMRGRVTNTLLMLASALAALAPLLAGLLVQHTLGAWAMGAFADDGHRGRAVPGPAGFAAGAVAGGREG